MFPLFWTRAPRAFLIPLFAALLGATQTASAQATPRSGDALPDFCTEHPENLACRLRGMAGTTVPDSDKIEAIGAASTGFGGSGAHIPCPALLYPRGQVAIGEVYSVAPLACGENGARATRFELIEAPNGTRLGDDGRLTLPRMHAGHYPAGSEITLRVRMCYPAPKPSGTGLSGAGSAGRFEVPGERVGGRIDFSPCGLGQREVTGSATVGVYDDDPMAVTRVDPTPWRADFNVTRTIRFQGGEAPYRIESLSRLPSGPRVRIVDVNEAGGVLQIAGRVRASVDGQVASFRLADAHGRSLEFDYTFQVGGVLMACELADLQGRCTRVDDPSGPDGGLALNLQHPVHSIGLEGRYRAQVCDQALLTAPCRNLRANPDALGHWTIIDRAPAERSIRSLAVWSTQPFPRQIEFVQTSPQQAEMPWSEAAQGIAHDATHWFLNNHDRIYRYPKRANRSGNAYDRHAGKPDGIRDFKDAAFSPVEQLLYVPAQGKPPGAQTHHAALVVFDRELNLRRVGFVPHRFCPDGDPLSVLAPHPQTGDLFAGCGAGEKRELHVFSKNFGDGDFLRHLYSVTLKFPWDDNADAPMTSIRYVQGGEFTPSGHLFIVAENLLGRRFVAQSGVYQFRLEGNVAQAVSRFPVGYGGGTHTCVLGECYRHNEIEGITIWDVGHAHIHVIKLENELGHDDAGIRQYRAVHPERL